MTKKYFCPHHTEKTPSAVAYANSYFSFCCGRSGPLSDLGLSSTERIETTYVEDIASSIARIKTLPKQTIRGFELHADERGYYLIWPDESYYKRRIIGAEAGNKYRGPSGHKKPPFIAQKLGTDSATLVEGEFNALSLVKSEYSGRDIISPGGAGDFYSRTGSEILNSIGTRYSSVYIVTDADAAGTQAAIETKARLITLGCPDVRIHLMERDFNDIHTQDGLEAVRAEAKRMGLL